MKESVWRKLLCITLAFALIIGMMPAIPGAVQKAHADTTITEVTVTDIVVPMVGKTPTYTGSVPAGAAYYIGTEIDGVNFDINGISWAKRSANNSLAEISSTVPFEEGLSYDVRMEIYAKDGYTFDAKVNITINGEEAHVISGTGNKLFVRYTFPTLTQEYIDSVALTMKGHKLNGLVRGLTFASNDPITVGSDYGTDKNYVVYLGNTTSHLTIETSEFYSWQQYYVGYYLEAKDGYAFNSLTPSQVTLNGKTAYSLTTQGDGRILAIFALEKLGYIHEIELEVSLPVADQQIQKPTVVSVDGDPNLKDLVTTEGSQWSVSNFFVDGAKYEKVNSGNFQNGMAYKLELSAYIADQNNYYLANDCKVTVKTSDGQILQREQTWAQDPLYYKQTNYFNLNAPTAYDTLKNWDMEIYGYNGGASLMNLSAKVTANGKTLMLPAGETFMIYEASFAEPEPPYLIKYDTQYILTMPLLTVDMDWPGVDWVIDDINNVKITLHGQPLSNSDLMNMEGHWWVMYKLPILKEGVDCNGITHSWTSATCTTPKTCTGCKATEGSALGHKPGAAATCTAPQKCTVCQATLNPALDHKAGTAKVTVKATATKAGKKVTSCSVCGVAMGTTIIKAPKVTLSKTAYTYTGKKVKAPTVRVKTAAGKTISSKYYTVTKPKNVTKMKDIGRYTYTVKFKSTCPEYKGSVKLTMEIKPNKTSITSTKAAKKAITVKWKKGKKAQVTGYQVMVATNSKFTKNTKTATVKGYSKVSKQMTKLKAKTKYYVKVRTYKTVKGVKIYSDWSKVKTVKTK